MTPLYSIDDFAFRYPFSRKILRYSGSNTVFTGDRIILTGDSGSGKSTFLMALKGLIPDFIFGCTEGRILFKNKPVSRLSPVESAGIGYIFQNPDTQIITDTVINELAFGLENLLYKKNEIYDRVMEGAELFGINHLLYQKTTNLSGGEKQKVALLSILLTNPSVILLDEPTAFLDPESAVSFVDSLHKCSKDVTMIVVEHNTGYFEGLIGRNINISSDMVISDCKPPQFLREILPKADYRFNGGQAILELDKIGFRYKDRELLTDTNLIVKSGEIISITGKNGAGKSTLLKIIAGIETNYTGKIIFDGVDTRRISNKDRYQKIAYLSQNPENHFLYNNVGRELKDVYFNTIDLLLGVDRELSPFTLSEGEKRRLSFCIAAGSHRRILLLDEPTFGLDIKTKIVLRDIICNYAAGGVAVLIVSHDMEFIDALSCTKYRIEGGKPIASE